MAKKRAKVKLDFGDKADLFTPTEEPTKPKKITSKERLQARVTYDIGAELKAIMKQDSIDLGVSASQLARYFLMYAIEDYRNGVLAPPPLKPSHSPAYRHNIDFDALQD